MREYRKENRERKRKKHSEKLKILFSQSSNGLLTSHSEVNAEQS